MGLQGTLTHLLVSQLPDLDLLQAALHPAGSPGNSPVVPASPLDTVIPLSHSSTIHPISAATTATSSLHHTVPSPRKEGKASTCSWSTRRPPGARRWLNRRLILGTNKIEP